MTGKVWERLQRFESRDYLEQTYQARHNRKLSAQRAHEIGTCFTQGREYFASARDSSQTVKPLLLYYGVASLSRGLILLKDPSKREESLTPGHGLSTSAWPDVLKGGISNVLSIGVQATRGTFPEFVAAIGNAESYIWRQQPGARSGHFKREFAEIKFLSDGSTLTLRDLLSREVDLASEFEIAEGAWGNTDFGAVVAYEDAIELEFLTVQGQDVPSILQKYLLPNDTAYSIGPSSVAPIGAVVKARIAREGESRKSVSPLAYRQDTQVGWLVRPMANGDNITSIHRAYVTSFMLGMLCRYFPSRWVSILRSDKGDIARSVILSAVARIEEKFPELASDASH